MRNEHLTPNDDVVSVYFDERKADAECDVLNATDEWFDYFVQEMETVDEIS
jgi:hypothetical protein